MAAIARTSSGDALDTEYDHLFKLIVVGNSGVGKSTLVSRFADEGAGDRPFVGTYMPTIGVDFKIKSIETPEGKNVKLQLWDTAGQDRFKAICASFYRGGHGIVLCYDVTDKESFEALSRTWLKEIASYAREDVRIMLVGTKTDLKDAKASSSGDEEWEEEAEAKELAEELGVPLLRCSSKTGTGVSELFVQFAQQLANDRAVRCGSEGEAEEPTPGIRLSNEGHGMWNSMCAC